MPVYQRRTGPSGSTSLTGSGPTASRFLGPPIPQPNPPPGGGVGLPGGLPGGGIQLGDQVAPSAFSLLEQGGLALCQQFFSGETCQNILNLIGITTGGGGSEPETGDPAIPGIVAGDVGTCPPGTLPNPFGPGCINLPGGPTTGGGMVITGGEAVSGRYGPAIAPQMSSRTRLRCPRGMVLGKDNLCYDKLRNSDRKWPKGRKPLLTGGELNAISRASTAADRMERQQKRLQKLGLLKKSTKTKKVYVCPRCRLERAQCTCGS